MTDAEYRAFVLSPRDHQDDNLYIFQESLYYHRAKCAEDLFGLAFPACNLYLLRRCFRTGRVFVDDQSVTDPAALIPIVDGMVLRVPQQEHRPYTRTVYLVETLTQQ